jgi:predicted nucleic acid-binding protein
MNDASAFIDANVSWQVIHEFYSAAVRKLRIPAQQARQLVEQMIEMGPEPLGRETIRRAWFWCDEAQLNYWDALMLAAAEESGCRWLLSEDFQGGRRYGSVTVVNPFERTPSDLGLS